MQRMLLFSFKAVVSGLLTYLALRSVQLSIVVERLSSLNLVWLVSAVLLGVAQNGIASVRWQAVAASETDKLTIASALKMTLIAGFFGQVLPASLGADAVRSLLLVQRGSSWAVAVYSVLIDRIIGVAALALIVIGCAPWFFALVEDPIARAAVLMLAMGALGASTAFLLLGFVRIGILDSVSAWRHLVAASRMAQRLCCQVGPAAKIVACSFAIHALFVTACFACARAGSAPIGFLTLLVLLPPVALVTILPISIGGWGVRETSVVVAFVHAGLSPVDGLLLSILFGLTSMVVGIIGGGVWLGTGIKTIKSAPRPPGVQDVIT